jgi:preprotein translocase subunit SecF
MLSFQMQGSCVKAAQVLQKTFLGAISEIPERARAGVRHDLNQVRAQLKAAGAAKGVAEADKKTIVGPRIQRYVRLAALHAIFWSLIALAVLIASRVYVHLSHVAAGQ